MIKEIVAHIVPFCVMAIIISPNSPVILKLLGWIIVIGMAVIAILVINAEKISKWGT